MAAAGVANAMTEALSNFIKDSPKHLKRVHIVIFQAKLLPDFQEAVKKCKKISRNASGMFQCMNIQCEERAETNPVNLTCVS